VKVLTLKKKYNVPRFKVVKLEISEDGTPFFMPDVGLTEEQPRPVGYEKGEYIKFNTLIYASVGVLALTGFLIYRKMRK